MSKVQSPKSKTESLEAVEARGSGGVAIQGKHAASGPGTLDFGLTVTDLRKSFLTPNGESITVLRGVSFTATAGESVVVMGVSGAGKSTLLQLLGGLETADHGSIAAGKFEVERASQPALARFRNEHVGFLFQFHHLLPDLTALENVSLPLLIRRIHPREAARQALQSLKELGLEDRAAHLVGNLSGGEQQRVALCRAVINRPSILLADEPTGNLDATIADEIAHSLVDYAKKAQAIVILATHSQVVANLCERVLTLHDGRLLLAP